MSKKVIIPDEVVMNKIYLIREQKVMLDMDLADLYGVETKQLKRAVRRNIDRFPDDFMFELRQRRVGDLEEPNWHLKVAGGATLCTYGIYRARIAMLSSVLNSDRAVTG